MLGAFWHCWLNASRLLRMRCDPVAFAVEDDGAETVRVERRFLLEDLPAVGAHGFDGGVEPAFYARLAPSVSSQSNPAVLKEC